MEQNLDLFAGRDELEPLVDNLHLIPDEEREKLWTGTLSDLLAVMLSEMKRAGVDEQQALNLSERLTIALSGYMGGRSLYLPAGGRLKTAVRDMLIYAEFNGRNIQQLQKKYRLSEPQVYAILKRERDVYIRRRQISLI
ncbi:TPA: positive regulator of late transcription [Salmonella enterica subsp. enterica serovar Infantis]|nr:positive regulator of late transcription [Salmonella enterica subsp. enterica serovar Infantis]HCJ0429062.1 positive regulator of late transcription [Salmonella enterica subsp. enterica serovar Infantis]